MPFDESFDGIYTGFIVPIVEKCGFQVARADDLANAQSIMKDIVSEISNTDIVIADLTSQNPNVFYELGLSHAMNKPTILLVQDIDDVPFDLKPYRVITYGEHFTEMDRARNDLADRLTGAIRGTTKFGSPISDFLSHPILFAIGGDPSEPNGDEEESEEGKKGILDYRIEVDEGFGRINDLLESVAHETNVIGEHVGQTTDLISKELSPQQLRVIIQNLAVRLNGYADKLDTWNSSYAGEVSFIAEPLEELIDFQIIDGQESANQLREQLDVLIAVDDAAAGAIPGFRQFQEAVMNTPDIEFRYNIAKQRVIRQLGQLIGNTEKIRAMIRRVQDVGEQKLDLYDMLGSMPK